MGDVLGEIIGNAVGVAISPLPLVAAIVLLMGTGGRAKGAAFVGGWLVGLTAVLVVFTVVGPAVSGDDPKVVVSVLKVVVGIGLALLAVRSWRAGRADEHEPPALMTRVQQASVGACALIGASLAALNPKNLGLTAAAGGAIGAADLTTPAAVVTGGVYLVLGSGLMLIVLGAAVLAPDRSEPALQRLREWLVTHNSAVMVVVLVVLAAKLAGDGLRGLS